MNKNFGDDYGFGIAVFVIVIGMIILTGILPKEIILKEEKSEPVVKQYIGIVC